MARVALIIANSVSSQPTVKAARSSKVSRTAVQVRDLFSQLPGRFAFEASHEIDQKPDRIEELAKKAAKRCSSHDGLLVIYYFGHARRAKDDLIFVHRGPDREKRSYLPFASLFHNVMAGAPNRVLFFLDCCYAGASGKEVDLLPESSRKKCCLIASTSASTRALWEDKVENPLGYFTLALIDGLSGPGGAVSATDDTITAESLFKFVKRETKGNTKGLQEPFMMGNLDEQLSRYSYKPVIIPGISQNVSDKSSYSKLIAIIRTIGKRPQEDTKYLYDRILVRHRHAFLTNFVDDDRRISQRPAHWTVLRRYIAFLRAISVVDEDRLMLTTQGLQLLDSVEDKFNTKLLSLLVRYLERQNGLTVDHLRGTMQRVMERRWLPTKENVLNDLFLEKGHELNEHHLGMVLDLLGCIGVLGTLRKRQQVYFPWNERPPRRSSRLTEL
jgi:hypothetical protein